MKNLEVKQLNNSNKRTVGLEFENPIIKQNGDAIDFDEIQQVWKTFAENGWTPRVDPIIENTIDGLVKEFDNMSASVMADAGAGNFEMALTPLGDINIAKQEFDLVWSEILSMFKKHNYLLTGFAIQPGKVKNVKSFNRRTAMYLAWYEMNSQDQYSCAISSAISAQQVGIGISIDEFVDATNELIKITAPITALCGNSPINNWKLLPYKEWRIVCMSHLRLVGNESGFEKLVGFPERPFKSIADFFKYFWDTPYMMLPMLRDGEWVVPDEKINFLNFFVSNGIKGHTLKGKKVVLTPEVDDINWASIQMWPHAKPHISVDTAKVTMGDFVKNLNNDSLEDYLEDKLTNCYIESRAGGTSPVGDEMAIPSLFLGLVNNMSELKEFTKRLAWKEWSDLVYGSAIYGMDTKVAGKSIETLLKDLIKISSKGLKERKLKEEKYLEVFKERIKNRENPADLAIKHFKNGKKNLIDYISY